MARFLHLTRQNSIYLALILLIGTILLSVGFIFYNRHLINANTALRLQTEAVAQQMRNCYDLPVRHIDVSLRGFALVHEERFLYLAPDSIEHDMERSFWRLDSLLTLQNFQSDTGKQNLAVFKAAMREYCAYHKQMVGLIRRDSMNLFLDAFRQDKGKQLWYTYQKVDRELTAFEQRLNGQAQLNYASAMNSNIYIQLFLFLFGIPTLVFVIWRLAKESANRSRLLTDLEENNRKYLFNPDPDPASAHPASGRQTVEQTIANSIDNFKKASQFVKSISAGNYNVEWPGLTEGNLPVNRHTLAGELLGMKKQMQKLKAEDDSRNWVNEGLASFSQTVRQNQHDLDQLCEHALRFLCKYLGAQQGSLFAVEESSGDSFSGDSFSDQPPAGRLAAGPVSDSAWSDHQAEGKYLDGKYLEGKYLQLRAAYAFDRKKFIQKRIAAGQGLLGQTYLEGDTVLLTRIPQNYTYITSGLGQATPDCLLIVPFRYNSGVEALLELVGFECWQQHQIQFLEKAGEFIASALVNLKTAAQTRRLLAQSEYRAGLPGLHQQQLSQQQADN